jgi:hypothetical protein
VVRIFQNLEKLSGLARLVCRCCSIALNISSSRKANVQEPLNATDVKPLKPADQERFLSINQDIEGKLSYPQERNAAYLSCLVDPTDHLTSDSLFVLFSQFARHKTSVKSVDLLGWGSKCSEIDFKPASNRSEHADWHDAFALSGFVLRLVKDILQYHSFSSSHNNAATIGSDGHKIVLTIEVQSTRGVQDLASSLIEQFSGSGTHTLIVHKKDADLFDVAFVIPVKASVSTRTRTLRGIFVINDSQSKSSVQGKKTA